MSLRNTKVQKSFVPSERSEPMVKRSLILEDGIRRRVVTSCGYSYDRAFRWDEIMEKCKRQLDSDLEPYFRRLRRSRS